MRSRRLYASRGFARRAPVRPRRTWRRSLVVLALGSIVAGSVATLAWTTAQPAAPPPPVVGAAAELIQSQTSARQVTDASSAIVPAGQPTALATADPATPLQRQWQTTSSDLSVDAALARELDHALAGVDGSLSIAVKDLGSGRGAVLDGDRELPAASLFKLPILFTVFESRVPLGEELVISEAARAYDAGTLELGVGETLSVAEALERMITLSDNTSAIMLGSRVGSARVSANIAALGMRSTHYSLERMTTSALDMLDLLELIADGKAVSSAASADMLHLLLRQRVNDRLPRLLPDDVQVAHKTGNLPGTVNDVGIVYGPTSTVAVAALVSDTADETAATTGIARLGLAAVTYFARQSEIVDRPRIPPPPARPVPPVWRQPRPVPTPTPTPQLALVPPEPTSETAAELEATATPAPTATPEPRPSPSLAPTAAPTPTLAPTPKPTALPAIATPPPPTATPPPPATTATSQAAASTRATSTPARPATPTPPRR